MVTITRAKYGVPISDIFFDQAQGAPDPQSSISFFVQSRSPHSGFVPFKTQIIDLAAEPAGIFSRISNSCRYKIKRAERESCIPVMSGSPSLVDVKRFADFFDEFARQKSLPPANRAKLSALAQADSLLLSSVALPDGEPLAMHAYVKDSEIQRVRLLYSASHFRGVTDSGLRNLIGRANRLLHWHEIEQLQQKRFREYDFGGIPIGTDDEAKNAIARFKREFGGSDVVEYNGFKATSSLGKMILWCSRRQP